MFFNSCFFYLHYEINRSNILVLLGKGPLPLALLLLPFFNFISSCIVVDGFLSFLGFWWQFEREIKLALVLLFNLAQVGAEIVVNDDRVGGKDGMKFGVGFTIEASIFDRILINGLDNGWGLCHGAAGALNSLGDLFESIKIRNGFQCYFQGSPFGPTLGSLVSIAKRMPLI